MLWLHLPIFCVYWPIYCRAYRANGALLDFLAFLEDLPTLVRTTSLHSGVYDTLSNSEKIILCLCTVVLYYYAASLKINLKL